MSTTTLGGQVGSLWQFLLNYLSDAGTSETSVVQPPAAFRMLRIGHGYGRNQAEVAALLKVTVAASGTSAVDLSGGFTGPDGAAIVPAKLKGIGYYNDSSVGVTVKKAGSSGFAGRFSGSTDTLSIPAGGFVEWYAPDGVSCPAGSDTETLTNASSTTAATVYVLALFTVN